MSRAQFEEGTFFPPPGAHPVHSSGY